MHIQGSGKAEKTSYFAGKGKMVPKASLHLKDGWFLNFSPHDLNNGVKNPDCVQAKGVFLKGKKSKQECKASCSKCSSYIFFKNFSL